MRLSKIIGLLLISVTAFSQSYRINPFPTQFPSLKVLDDLLLNGNISLNGVGLTEGQILVSDGTNIIASPTIDLQPDLLNVTGDVRLSGDLYLAGNMRNTSGYLSDGEFFISNGTTMVATTAIKNSDINQRLNEKLDSTFGYADYNDLATQTASITYTSGNLVLPNDAEGSFSTDLLPTGVSDIWLPLDDRFDFSSLPLGSTVDIRFDIEVTTDGANQEVTIGLVMNEGGNEFTVPFFQNTFKVAAAHQVSTYNGLYIGNDEIRTSPAYFNFSSDGSASIKVNGWYIKVRAKRW